MCDSKRFHILAISWRVLSYRQPNHSPKLAVVKRGPTRTLKLSQSLSGEMKVWNSFTLTAHLVDRNLPPPFHITRLRDENVSLLHCQLIFKPDLVQMPRSQFWHWFGWWSGRCKVPHSGSLLHVLHHPFLLTSHDRMVAYKVFTVQYIATIEWSMSLSLIIIMHSAGRVNSG